MTGRRLGQGYSLALKTGSGTHITLLYFNSLKRGYEQDMVKSRAEEYFQERGLLSIDLVLGEPHQERSIRVHGEVEQVIKDLAEIFKTHDIDPTQIPHIDLRGADKSELELSVATIQNWNH